MLHACIFCAVPHSEAWAEQKTLKDNLCSKLLFKKSFKYFFDSECAVYYLTKHIWFLQHRPIIIGSILALSYSHPGCGMMGHDGGTRSSSTKGTTVYTCGKSARTNPQFWKQTNPGNELFSETSQWPQVDIHFEIRPVKWSSVELCLIENCIKWFLVYTKF